MITTQKVYSVEDPKIIGAIIAAIATLVTGIVGGLVTLIVAIKKASAGEAKAYLDAGIEMNRLTSEANNRMNETIAEASDKLRDDLMVDMARIENERRDARRDAEEARALLLKTREDLHKTHKLLYASERREKDLIDQLDRVKLESAAAKKKSEKQLQVAMRAIKKMLTILSEYVPEETLEEITGIPEEVRLISED